MITIEKTDVYGWEASIRGLRNPMNSWDKSDTIWGEKREDGLWQYSVPQIGENDLALMKKLAKAGNDHAKFLRMINVTVDITAPLYWWKEFDTYKVGTVANSCSTMHKIHAKEFTLDDFSYEHLTLEARDFLETTVDYLNYCRNKFLDTKDKIWWWQMIQLLPSSYNQKRTVQMNYQVLTPMYFARRHHKLDCWHTLCDWMLELPYFRDISIQE
jgi:hypothetical protein